MITSKSVFMKPSVTDFTPAGKRIVQWKFPIVVSFPKRLLYIAPETEMTFGATGKLRRSQRMKSFKKILTTLSLSFLTFVGCLAAFGQSTTVTKIAAGHPHSIFLKSDGSLWGMGANYYGQLGDGSTNDSIWPRQIISSNVVAIAAGDLHSLFIKSDGSLWTMGWNAYGQLGDGSTTNHHSPVRIVSSNVTTVVAGGFHSLFLKSDGSLWAMGWNASGQLGDGTVGDRNIPVQIISSNVVAIAAGWEHSLFVKSDGSLWAMGMNYAGQLGNGTPSPYINTPEQIISSGVSAICGGEAHSLLIKSNGSLWAMGANNRGQLGNGTTTPTFRPEQIVPSNVVAIAVGVDHSLFLKTDGSLWGMGRRGEGELGDGMPPPYYTNRPEQVVSGDVIAIAAGFGSDSLFIKSDGSLWGMGLNWTGELGIGQTGATAVRFHPVPIVPDPPNPVIVDWHFSGTDLILQATNGVAGCTYYLLMSASAALPLSQWVLAGTSAPVSNGVFTLTATNAFAPNAPQRFYSLQVLR